MRQIALVPLLALAALAMLAGSWAGLLRLGLALPPLQVTWVVEHGGLMISGFLGTLISLERAIALSAVMGSRLPYAAPVVAALGALALLLGLPAPVGRGLAVVASLGLVAIFAVINRLQFNWPHAIMGLGALTWLAGNVLWFTGRPVYQVVPWWVAFLVFTIAGERLELARVLLLRRAAVVTFVAAVGTIVIGLLAAFWQPIAGLRLGGLGLAGLGLWLLRYDVARITVRQRGLTRFMALCLLPGYAWLAIAGGLWFVWAERFTAGPWYDAMLHAVLLGFVFSMIFAHAPIILPAVTGRRMLYHAGFYAHLALLHASLLMRVAGDLALQTQLRQWGGTLNVIAIVLFAANSAAAVAAAAWRERQASRQQHA
jgi:hypothetical protein